MKQKKLISNGNKTTCKFQNKMKIIIKNFNYLNLKISLKVAKFKMNKT